MREYANENRYNITWRCTVVVHNVQRYNKIKKQKKWNGWGCLSPIPVHVQCSIVSTDPNDSNAIFKKVFNFNSATTKGTRRIQHFTYSMRFNSTRLKKIFCCVTLFNTLAQSTTAGGGAGRHKNKNYPRDSSIVEKPTNDNGTLRRHTCLSLRCHIINYHVAALLQRLYPENVLFLMLSLFQNKTTIQVCCHGHNNEKWQSFANIAK